MTNIETLLFDFELVHKSGDRLYPVRIQSATGKKTFRCFNHGNLNSDSAEIDDANEVVSHFLGGKGIRCSSRNGSRKGVYTLNGRSIVRFHDKTKGQLK